MADFIERLQAAVGDNYRIEDELGGGGMSRVFVAEETRLRRQVVIKVLPPVAGLRVGTAGISFDDARWAEADAGLQPTVTDVRGRIVRLVGEGR